MEKTTQPGELRIIPIPFSGEILPGDSLAEKLLQALNRSRQRLRRGDILVVKHKIVSKAEEQLVDLDGVRPSSSSRAWARRYRLDPRVVEIVLSESDRIVRRKRGVLISETRRGCIERGWWPPCAPAAARSGPVCCRAS
jgi:coenzyme F420-0:L-glutamate ligase / coenzyme F420-1:gamma-L-glutamate ligase